MTPIFSDATFQHCHGNKPQGIGTWAFDVVSPLGVQTVSTPLPMGFPEARKWAFRTFCNAQEIRVAA